MTEWNAFGKQQTIETEQLVFGTNIGRGAWWRNFGLRFAALRLGGNVAGLFVQTTFKQYSI